MLWPASFVTFLRPILWIVGLVNVFNIYKACKLYKIIRTKFIIPEKKSSCSDIKIGVFDIKLFGKKAFALFLSFLKITFS